MSYQAEYIWIDGTEPHPCCGPRPRSSRRRGAGHLGLRRVVDEPGDRQRLGLRALAGFVCRTPCGTPATSWSCARSPHRLTAPDNTGQVLAAAEKYADQEPWIRIEQEYTFLQDGRRTCGPEGYRTQGPTTAASAATRCPAGHRRAPHQGLHGRRARHRGHQRRGDDGQWEFRSGFSASRHRDQLWVAAGCSSASRGFGVFATLEPSVVGDWNGAGPTPTSRPRPCAPRAAGTPSSPGAAWEERERARVELRGGHRDQAHRGP